MKSFICYKLFISGIFENLKKKRNRFYAKRYKYDKIRAAMEWLEMKFLEYYRELLSSKSSSKRVYFEVFRPYSQNPFEIFGFNTGTTDKDKFLPINKFKV